MSRKLLLFMLFMVSSVFLFGMEGKTFDDRFLFLKLNISPGFGASDGDYFTKEQNQKISVMYSDYSVKSANPTISPGLLWGFGAEYLIKRFGICLDFQRVALSENITIGGGDYQLYTNTSNIFDLSNLKLGINYHLFPFNFSYISGSFYAGISGGYLWGDYKPFAAIQGFVNNYSQFFTTTLNEVTQWNDSFSVGVAEFDNQHKKLIELINLLYDAMKAGKGKDVLGKIFSDLIEYTKVHFASEEKLMDQFHYSDVISHSDAHKELTQKVLELQAEYIKGNVFISIDTMNFLKDWLTKHILSTDKKYGKFFNDAGVK